MSALFLYIREVKTFTSKLYTSKNEFTSWKIDTIAPTTMEDVSFVPMGNDNPLLKYPHSCHPLTDDELVLFGCSRRNSMKVTFTDVSQEDTLLVSTMCNNNDNFVVNVTGNTVDMILRNFKSERYCPSFSRGDILPRARSQLVYNFLH